MTVKVIDVAEYILGKLGQMPAMKLQKLVYYSQAWHAVWSDSPLFNERIEAWANGPVVPHLYASHRQQFILTPGQFHGDASSLSTDEADSVNKVLSHYGERTSQWLSDLTHMEAPWQDARKGLAPGERSDNQIELGAIVEYYGSL